MNTFNIIFRDIDRNHFERIKDGTKTIEIRAGSPEYNNISTGDQLVISCGDDTITKTVLAVYKFKNIPELLNSLDKELIWKKGITDEEATKMLNSFPNYQERIQQFGLIAWKL